METGNEKIKDSAIKIMAVIGTIAVLSLGGFLTVAVINKAPGFASRIVAQVASVTKKFIPAERIEVTLNNENPENGDRVTLSFNHIDKEEDGSYSFFYECREGIYFERDGKIIFCNTPYDFINTDDSFVFDVFSRGSEQVEVPLSINFIKNNSDRISERGEARIKINGNRVQTGGTILVVNENTDAQDSRSRNTTRTAGERTEETILIPGSDGNTNPGRSNPVGITDLKATILGVGRIDRATNAFTATSSISLSDRGAVKFEVENVGTAVSPSWTFNVVVPTFPAFIYHSNNQQPLQPGDKIEYTIGFDSIKSDGKPNTIVVNVDPISSIKESTEANNIVKAELKAF
jgi:hypothetical protein